MAAISYYYQAMVSPEAICGNCKFFDRKDTSGETIGAIVTDEGKIDKGLCRAPMGLILGIRTQIVSCRMPEGTFEAIPTSLIQNPSTLQESLAL